jgi:flagellar hook-length control protein FliK
MTAAATTTAPTTIAPAPVPVAGTIDYLPTGSTQSTPPATDVPTVVRPTTNPSDVAVNPVLAANPPVEVRQPAGPPTSKPTGSAPVTAHDPPTNPVPASRPLVRPNGGSGTGSDSREHATDRQPTVSAGFSLTDASPSSTTAPMPGAQPVPSVQSITVSQPISQPATVQSAPTSHADLLPVSQQLAGPVLSLRTAGDGNHQLTIALHPAELGPVNVHVRIVGDSMAIQLASSSSDAHDALREALPQLRQELQAAGLHNVDLHSVDLSLDLGGSGAQTGSRADQDYRPGRSDEAPVDRPTVRTERQVPHTDSGLDRWL